jgi:hypothetical protein
VSEERQIGRPPVDPNGSSPVHVKVPNVEFDEADDVAKRAGITVPQLMRISLKRLLKDIRDGSVVIRRGGV